MYLQFKLQKVLLNQNLNQQTFYRHVLKPGLFLFKVHKNNHPILDYFWSDGRPYITGKPGTPIELKIFEANMLRVLRIA